MMGGAKDAFAEWASDPMVERACQALLRDSYRASESRPFDGDAGSVGKAALGLKDPVARLAVLRALARGSDPICFDRIKGECVAADDALSLGMCFEAAGGDPTDPRWLGVCAMAGSAGCARWLILGGCPAAIPGGLSAVELSSHAASGAVSPDNGWRLAWSQEKAQAMAALLCEPKNLAALDPEQRIGALDAMASNLRAGSVMGSDTKKLDVEMFDGSKSLPSAQAFGSLWASLDDQGRQRARGACWLLFEIHLKLDVAAWRMLGARGGNVLGDPPSGPALESIAALAAQVDWAAFERGAAQSGWSLGGAAMRWLDGMGKKGCDGSEIKRAAFECFDAMEAAWGRPLERSEAILAPPAPGKLAWPLAGEEPPGSNLAQWLRSRGRKLPATAVAVILDAHAEALGAFARACAAGGHPSRDGGWRGSMRGFDKEMVAAYRLGADSARMGALVNRLANDWGAASKPEGLGPGVAAFLHSWVDKLALGAVAARSAGLAEDGPAPSAGRPSPRI